MPRRRHGLRPGLLLAAAGVGGVAALVLGVLFVSGVWPRHRAAIAVSAHGSLVVVRTAAGSRVYLEYGPDRSYGLYTAESGLAQVHRFRLADLDPGGRYHFRAVARVGGRELFGPDLVLTAPAGPGVHSLRVVAGHLVLDGRPWIPRFTWGSCAADYASEAALGIDAFMSSNCGDSPEQQARAALKVGGLVIPALDQVRRALPTTVATYLADEPDLEPIPPAQLAQAWSAHPDAHGLPVFLTFSAHAAAAGAADDTSGYADYVRLADVLGIDVYPISSSGDPSRIVDVANAQQALRTLAGGKPTFQWIEATRPAGDSGTIPTAAEVEAEAWLAIANGARALGWWTNDGTTPFSVTAADQSAIQHVDAALDTFAPAIAAPITPVTLDNTGIDVFATRRNGALTVFAVSTNPNSPVYEVFNLPGLAGRPVHIWNTSNTLTPTRDSFTDTLPPLAWRIYLIPPR